MCMLMWKRSGYMDGERRKVENGIINCVVIVIVIVIEGSCGVSSCILLFLAREEFFLFFLFGEEGKGRQSSGLLVAYLLLVGTGIGYALRSLVG